MLQKCMHLDEGDVKPPLTVCRAGVNGCCLMQHGCSTRLGYAGSSCQWRVDFPGALVAVAVWFTLAM